MIVYDCMNLDVFVYMFYDEVFDVMDYSNFVDCLCVCIDNDVMCDNIIELVCFDLVYDFESDFFMMFEVGVCLVW